MIEKFIELLEKLMMPCFYKQVLGVDCPSCGGQRAIVELLKGNIIESFILFPSLIPLLLTLALYLVYLFKRTEKLKKILQMSLIVNLTIMIVYYLYKIMAFNLEWI